MDDDTDNDLIKLGDRLVSVLFGICILIGIVAFFLLGVRVGLQVQVDRGICSHLEK